MTMKTPRPGERIRVMLVDDQRIVRDGLRLSLELQADLEVVGDAGDGAVAMQFLNELHPDAVVTDICLPDCDGLDLSLEIIRRRPETRIVVLAGSVDRELLDRAVAAGIHNCVSKREAASELHTAIRRAMLRQAYLSQELIQIFMENYQVLLAHNRRNGQSLLSARETTILKLIADGRNTKEIAGELGLGAKSVDYYRKRLMTKLGLHSVAGLTKYAIRKRLTKA